MRKRGEVGVVDKEEIDGKETGDRQLRRKRLVKLRSLSRAIQKRKLDLNKKRKKSVP